MSCKKRRNHDEEKHNSDRKDDKEVGIKAHKCIDCKERQGMRWHCPMVQTYELVLEDEDNSNPCVESAKVVGHER